MNIILRSGRTLNNIEDINLFITGNVLDDLAGNEDGMSMSEKEKAAFLIENPAKCVKAVEDSKSAIELLVKYLLPYVAGIGLHEGEDLKIIDMDKMEEIKPTKKGGFH